jgi:hypothetical protein
VEPEPQGAQLFASAETDPTENQWNTKVKKIKNEMTIFWETVLLH